jgi:hypothetical protein
LKAGIDPIAFSRITALAESLEVTEIVAAAEVERDDVIDRKVFGGAAALAGVMIAIEDVLADGCGDFSPWGFVGFHGLSRKASRDGSIPVSGGCSNGRSVGFVSGSSGKNSIDNLTRPFFHPPPFSEKRTFASIPSLHH